MAELQAAVLPKPESSVTSPVPESSLLMSNADDPSVAALMGISWSPLGRWSTAVSSAVIVEGPSHSDGLGSRLTLVRAGPFAPDQDSGRGRTVVPKLAEPRNGDHNADDHRYTANRRGHSGADDGADRPVPEVGHPRAARDDDDEHALHPSAHLVGGHGLQHRRSEHRADEVARPGDREQQDREPERAGEPEQGDARPPDADRHRDRDALPPDPREPSREEAADDRARGDRGEQQAERDPAARRITEGPLGHLGEQDAWHAERHRDDVDEERDEQHLVHR